MSRSVRCLVWLCAFVVFASGCVESSEAVPEPAATVQGPPALKFDFKPLPSAPALSVQPRADVKSPRFEDVAESLGIRHVFDNGESSKALMVESTGGGAGWLDYDVDGKLDLLLTQGGVPDIPAGSHRSPDALYRQRNGSFGDVAQLADIGDRGFGHGAIIGDYDNDGFDDVFIANVGRCNLYRNLGDGTFDLATTALKGKRDVWSAGGAWGDVDRDGDLDLYVCNYAKYDPYDPVKCSDARGFPAICHPRNVSSEPDEFFRNEGDGTFVECSQAMGLFGSGNLALGVVIADLTDDGWPDIFVANDTSANFLFVSQEGKRFEESALVLGGAFSATGEPQANMGVACGDFDRNGLPDLCITHFTGEGVALYQNIAGQGLQEVSASTGLRRPTQSRLGFGAVMSDFNFDFQMDLFLTNGHIDPAFRDTEGYEMAPQLFSFDDVNWIDQSKKAGPFFEKLQVGRAVAAADYDRDGDVDLAVIHHNRPAALLRNDSERGHFLGVSLTATASNRNGSGAHVRVEFGDRRLTEEFAGGTSYASTRQRRAAFGLDDWTGPCKVSIDWPSGIQDEIEVPQPDRDVVVIEGQGQWSMASEGE